MVVLSQLVLFTGENEFSFFYNPAITQHKGGTVEPFSKLLLRVENWCKVYAVHVYHHREVCFCL